MRISSMDMFNKGIGLIMQGQVRVTDLQEHLSTGKRVLNAADDPIAASRIVQLKDQISRIERFNGNIQSAESHLNEYDVVIEQSTAILQRIRELHIQASNSFLNEAGHRAISAELEAQFEELLALGNTKDSTGCYIFSGFQSSNLPFVLDNTGQVIYQGDEGERFLEISDGTQIKISETGFDIFSNHFSGNGRFSVSESATPNTGSSSVGETYVSDNTAFVPDTYTLSFVTNAAGEVAYQVIGANSGQVIPPLPAVIPNNAVTFQPDQLIEFNGHAFKISGQPAVGDSYVIEPSQAQSIFETIQNIVDTLELPSLTPSQQARISNQLNQQLAEIDNVLNNLIDKRTNLGARMHRVDNAKFANEDMHFQSEKTLSDIESLDIAAAYSQLQTDILSLEIAQKTFSMIHGLSLMNYL